MLLESYAGGILIAFFISLSVFYNLPEKTALLFLGIFSIPFVALPAFIKILLILFEKKEFN